MRKYKNKSKKSQVNTLIGTDCYGCKLHPCAYHRIMGMNKTIPLGQCGDREEMIHDKPSVDLQNS